MCFSESCIKFATEKFRDLGIIKNFIMEIVTSYRPVPPGSLIKESLNERAVSQKEFAEAIGVRPSHITEIIKGNRRITVSFAEKVEDLLGIPASTLLDMQMQVDIVLKSNNAENIQECNAKIVLEQLDKTINVAALLKGEGLSRKSAVERLSFIQTRYGIWDAVELQNQFSSMAEACFRRSATKGLDERMIATWVVKARAEAKEYKPTKTFSLSSEEDVCKKIVAILHQNKDTKRRLRSVLNNYGIGFCEVQKLDHASIDGYSFMIGGVPYIVITGRYNRIDNLAFTVMHELGHIYLGHTDESTGRINVDTRSFRDDLEMPLEEAADAFASSWLIPDIQWRLAPTVPMNPFIIQKRYSEWATKKNLNKWIVLGRLSHETGIYKFKSDKTRFVNVQEGGVS